MRLQFAIAILVFSLRNAENRDVESATTTKTSEGDEDATAMVRQIFEDAKQRGANGSINVADQETKASVTLINRTESGFMPSFHLGPASSVPGPLINIPNQQPAAAIGDQRQSARQTANSNRLNSIFNNVRAITFDSNMSNNQNQSQQQEQPQPQPPMDILYRPADPIEKLVKFIEEKEDGDKRLYRHDAEEQQQQECSKTPAKLTSHSYGDHQATALLHEANYHHEQQQQHHHHHHHEHQHQPENNYADYNNAVQQHQYGAYDAKPSKFHDSPSYAAPASYQYDAYESKPAKFHDSSSYSAPAYHQTIIPVENTFKYFHPNQIHDSYHQHSEHKQLVKPDAVISYHPISYQSSSLSYDNTKPKTLLFVTHHQDDQRKFPYNYYQSQPQQQQSFDHSELSSLAEQHDYQHQYPLYYEQQKSISPWKKILHIIGAFLPLGLLFALLSPRVVTTNTNNDPGIVLSKLRVNDLLAEHKKSSNSNRAAALDTKRIAAAGATSSCEERSICRLLLATDSRTAEFLKQLVLRVTERTPESAVRKRELDGIFEAAKLGNCDILTCSFYDAT